MTSNPVVHPDIEVTAGGTLLDLDGSALDLTDAVLTWILTDPNGAAASHQRRCGHHRLGERSGLDHHQRQQGRDRAIRSRRHTDKLRVTVNGRNDVMWTGSFPVAANLFAVRPPDWPAPLPWPLPPVPRPLPSPSGSPLVHRASTPTDATAAASVISRMPRPSALSPHHAG
jgi:hypothetical protein